MRVILLGLVLLLFTVSWCEETVSTCPQDACQNKLTEETSCDMIPVSCLNNKDAAKVYSDCHYGATVTFNYTYIQECLPYIPDRCKSITSRDSQCKYCFQMDEKYYSCDNTASTCNPKSSASDMMITVICEVNAEVICKPPRIFHRKVACSYTTGKSWSTALLLSITLGGFGADRFYLGYWKEGLGKLFSFGGLGVWTIVDIILISVGYVAPVDHSLYILT